MSFGFPFTISAPITFGRRGPTGPMGPTPTTFDWVNITGKPVAFAPSAHTHVSLDIADASTVPVYNETTELFEEVAALYNENGELNAAGFIAEGGTFHAYNGDDFVSVSLSGSPFNFKIGTKQFRFNQPVGNGGQYNMPDGSGTLALTSSASGSIVSADISDATTTGQANKVIKLNGAGGLACAAITASGAISTTGAASHISTGNANAAVMSSNFLPIESGGASLRDGSYNACLTWGQSGRNLTIPSGVAVAIDATNFTLGTGAASALKTALAIASADITDATSTPTANKVIKYGANAQATAAWYQFPTVVSASTFNVTPLIFCPDYSSATPASAWEPVYGLPLIPEVAAAATLVITQNTDGSADTLKDGTISGAVTLNSTVYDYGMGAAAAHRAALNIVPLTDPEMIRGLQLKLAADDLQYQGLTAIANNDAVASWRAPNKPSAITAEIVFSQATVASRPIYRTNIQNSLPGVFFDGSNDLMTANAALMSVLGNHARTVFVVCRPTALASGGAGTTWNRPQIYSNAGQFNGLSVSPSASSNAITAWDYDTTGVIRNVSTAAVAPNTTVLLTHKHDKGVSSLSLNQGAPVTTSVLRDCTNATIMQLGSNGAGSGFYQGFIFEILMYARVLTPPETLMAESYLKAKWGV
jgi:hypothetical protein